MFTITHNILINCDKESVFSYISNYNNDIFWRTGVVMMKQSTNGFTCEGTTVKEIIKFMGLTFVNVSRVMEYKDNEKVAFMIMNGLRDVTGYREVKQTDKGTLFTYSLTFNIKGSAHYLISVFKKNYAKRIKQDLEKLKYLLERKKAEAA